jgi:hypothetical protein
MHSHYRSAVCVAVVLTLAGCGPSKPPAAGPAPATGTVPATGNADKGETPAKADTSEPVKLQPYREREGKEVYPSADVKLEAKGLAAEISADRKETDKKYEGKVAEVQGRILSYFSAKDSVSVKLDVGEEGNGLDVDLRQDRPWLKWPPGSTVTVRGKVGGFAVAMSRGWIMEGEAATPENVDLAAVAAKFKADPDGLAKENRGKTFRLKGKVVSTEDKGDSKIVVLLGDAAAPVAAQIENYEMIAAGGWKAGDEVELLASYYSLGSNDRPTYNNVLVVSPLPEYPQWPEKVTRKTEYSEGKYLPFTADLLGEWLMRSPRILEWQLTDTNESSELEVVGKVESIEKDPAATGEERQALLKNASGAKIRVALEEPDKLKVAAGDTLVVRGAAARGQGECTFGRPTIEKR